MKKTLLIILIITTIISFIVIKPIRTKGVMKSIAEEEFQNIPIYDSLRMQLKGPIVVDKEKYIEFEWYKVLEWNDTSAVYIDVYKNPINNLSNFFSPRITMNYQWYYFVFQNGTSRFQDILPNYYANKKFDLFDFKLDDKQQKIKDSITFSIDPDRLLFFLKKGYFQVLDQKKSHIIVDFYEPIAYGRKQNNNIKKASLMSAKIYVNDSFKVLIIPYTPRK